MPAKTSNAPKSPARSRVLDTATRLFYTEGVHSVGIDRIIAEAGVAKATFYHHFPAKDALVQAYIEEQTRMQREAAEQLEADGPREKLLAVFDHMGRVGGLADFRGCPFINAAAEYPDPAHPVRRSIEDYRTWFRELMRELLTEAGDPDAERTADLLMLIRDGLAVACDLDDPVAPRPLVRDAVLRVIGGARDGAEV
ncbi:TetR/AcrR family transcriptional regulator [Streptomyces indicus]|uniref:DNA-binding transcriptional regulator, AcrR family n=1 Tax=Streptomyces indicus TaxID=417292 RepID=A0A1G9ANH8_9ACTN|nr:TetR/AcrR family transcriptional regulator [Streptomyces indicus]SDK28827.1 DNA-binding transcriptional regulator, AcrR family [Streptomyces indicus]